MQSDNHNAQTEIPREQVETRTGYVLLATLKGLPRGSEPIQLQVWRFPHHVPQEAA